MRYYRAVQYCLTLAVLVGYMQCCSLAGYADGCLDRTNVLTQQ